MSFRTLHQYLRLLSAAEASVSDCLSCGTRTVSCHTSIVEACRLTVQKFQSLPKTASSSVRLCLSYLNTSVSGQAVGSILIFLPMPDNDRML